MFRSVFIFLFLTILCTQIQAQTNQKHWVSFGSDAKHKVQEKFSVYDKNVVDRHGISYAQLNSSELNELSHMMHEEFKRCGGFFFHETREEAERFQNALENRSLSEQAIFADYSITEQDEVTSRLPLLKSERIEGVIRKLSSFHNRYYTSDSGVEATEWIAEKWTKLTSGRSDMSVELYEHDRWPQSSVILTIEGDKKPNESIVLGGHADSIAGWWGRDSARAPGADDNASGIATLTEVIRVLVETNYRPEHTIKFMAYAAEEVGLRGSKDIAGEMKDRSENVVGVLQLDMTNFQGSEEWDITLISDYTNEEQNTFLGKLMDSYLQDLTWGYDDCGYACSDHASWNANGFPASFPFEAKSHDRNPEIHTDADDMAFLGDNAEHATKFAKLAMAYLVELDR